MAWCELGEKSLKNANVGKSAGKLMVIFFWDFQGALLTYCIPKDVNVNSLYYCKVLHELKADICRKQSNLRNEQIIFIYDNADPHFSEFTMAFFDELGWFILPHPAFSPDLAPNDFWLFLSSKISWMASLLQIICR